MNRTALGLAIGAGYLLGRTKKLKMALAVGSVVAGKKLNLTPRAIGELVQQQLRDNPQFKEIGDQLRQDMRGVGKAATGAMAERQINALADRLHGRTADVRDRLSGVAPGSEDEESREDSGDDEPRDDTDDAAADEDTSGGGREDREDREDEDTSGARRQERPRKKAAQKAPAKKSSAASTAKKAAAKAPAKKTGAARKTAAKKTASAGSGRSRQEKGGDDR